VDCSSRGSSPVFGFLSLGMAANYVPTSAGGLTGPPKQCLRRRISEPLEAQRWCPRRAPLGSLAGDPLLAGGPFDIVGPLRSFSSYGDGAPPVVDGRPFSLTGLDQVSQAAPVDPARRRFASGHGGCSRCNDERSLWVSSGLRGATECRFRSATYAGGRGLGSGPINRLHQAFCPVAIATLCRGRRTVSCGCLVLYIRLCGYCSPGRWRRCRWRGEPLLMIPITAARSLRPHRPFVGDAK